ncbi:hypothetical protein JXA32_00980 [Candidatus Sumerlaeota bacterium]|nr:hypothetical protein [Candidatus Sumerlaeota bacterium]
MTDARPTAVKYRFQEELSSVLVIQSNNLECFYDACQLLIERLPSATIDAVTDDATAQELANSDLFSSVISVKSTPQTAADVGYGSLFRLRAAQYDAVVTIGAESAHNEEMRKLIYLLEPRYFLVYDPDGEMLIEPLPRFQPDYLKSPFFWLDTFEKTIYLLAFGMLSAVGWTAAKKNSLLKRRT